MPTLPPVLRSTDEEEPGERWRAEQARVLTQWEAEQNRHAQLIQLKLRVQRFAPGMPARLRHAEAIPYARASFADVSSVPATGAPGEFNEGAGVSPIAEADPVQQALVAHLGADCTLEEVIHLDGTPYAATVRFSDGFRADVFIDALDPLTPPEPLR